MLLLGSCKVQACTLPKTFPWALLYFSIVIANYWQKCSLSNVSSTLSPTHTVTMFFLVKSCLYQQPPFKTIQYKCVAGLLNGVLHAMQVLWAESAFVLTFQACMLWDSKSCLFLSKKRADETFSLCSELWLMRLFFVCHLLIWLYLLCFCGLMWTHLEKRW